MSQGYSQLFQSISSGGGMGSQNFLSDYASIKNGSYGKLLKSYYSMDRDSGTTASGKKSESKSVLDKILEERKNPKISKEVEEANANLTAGIAKLKGSVTTLQSDKTYADGQNVSDKIVTAMKNFVTDYNNVVTSAKRSTLESKTAYVANMMSSTSANADKLSELGVTIKADGTLQLNEKKLKEAEASKVQELFSKDDIMSYGSKISSRIEFANSASGGNTTNGTEGTDSTDSEDSSSSISGAASLKADGKTMASDELYAKIVDKDGNDTGKYDIEKIFAAAKSFVKSYNSMLDSAESSTNSGVLANLSQIRKKTADNADILKQFGITVNNKGRMEINADTFKKSDMSQVQNFFRDYGSSVATNASLVDYYMTTQASAANGYTAAGAYNVQGSARYADFV